MASIRPCSTTFSKHFLQQLSRSPCLAQGNPSDIQPDLIKTQLNAIFLHLTQVFNVNILFPLAQLVNGRA